MSKPIDLNKLNAKIELMLSLISDLDMQIFELRDELRKRSGPGGLTPHRGLIIEHIAN